MSPATSYIDWMRGGRLSSYVRALHAQGPLGFVESAQPAGDMSDPPVDDLVLIQAMSPGMRQTSDLGAGRFSDVAPFGALLAMPPGVATAVHVDNPHVIRTIAFPAAWCRDTLAELRPRGDPFDFERFHTGHVVAPELRRLFDLSFAAADRPDTASRLFQEGMGLAMLAEMARLIDAAPPPRVGGLARWQERRAIDFLRSHLAEEVSLERIATEARLSPFHFARMFKVSTGLPPAAYQRRLRLEEAQRLLLETDLPITEIALRIGYETPQAFARMFRAATGASPSDWRRERRG
ncbi:MAG: AraC family transcriptional regulator [Sphingomonas sp.]|nr:AraC family transcriptional regulator [Sphingomonas sp.]